MTPRMIRLGGLILCALSAGCSMLAPVADRSRYYTLSAVSDAPAERPSASPRQTGTGGDIVYGLGPIKLPTYLDRHEIATRISPTEISYSPTDRWAEPLSTTVASVLLQDLSALLATDRIVPYPWLDNVKADYQIAISIVRFESDAAGASQLTARWAIRDVRTAAYVVTKETSLTSPSHSGDGSAKAAALSAMLGDLSQEIAAALRSLPAPAPAPTPSRRKP